MSAISNEKTITLFLWSMAAFRTKLKANAVLPIAGRAAKMTKSEGCQPPFMRSISLKPEATPVMPLFSLFMRASISLRELVINVLIS